MSGPWSRPMQKAGRRVIPTVDDEVFVVVPPKRRHQPRRKAPSYTDVLDAMACMRDLGLGTKVYRVSDGALVARLVPAQPAQRSAARRAVRS